MNLWMDVTIGNIIDLAKRTADVRIGKIKDKLFSRHRFSEASDLHILLNAVVRSVHSVHGDRTGMRYRTV